LFSVYYSKKIEKFPIRLVRNLIRRIKKSSKKKSNYYLNGAIYICKTNFLLKKKTFYHNKSIPFFMPKNRSIDIDTAKEFNQATTFLSIKNC
jgi:CMP-N,N'-diacetyllegionaminic acid synthase